MVCTKTVPDWDPATRVDGKTNPFVSLHLITLKHFKACLVAESTYSKDFKFLRVFKTFCDQYLSVMSWQGS